MLANFENIEVKVGEDDVDHVVDTSLEAAVWKRLPLLQVYHIKLLLILANDEETT